MSERRLKVEYDGPYDSEFGLAMRMFLDRAGFQPVGSGLKVDTNKYIIEFVKDEHVVKSETPDETEPKAVVWGGPFYTDCLFREEDHKTLFTPKDHGWCRQGDKGDDPRICWDRGGCLFFVRTAAAEQADETEGPQDEGGKMKMDAAIALRVPDSGLPWLDAMIRKSLRDSFAGQALADIAGDQAKICVIIEAAYQLADEAMRARNNDTP